VLSEGPCGRLEPTIPDERTTGSNREATAMTSLFSRLRAWLWPVRGIQRTVGGPHGEDQMQQLLHAVPQRDIASNTPRSQTSIECLHGWVMYNRALCGVPQIPPYNVGTFVAHHHRARRNMSSFAGSCKATPDSHSRSAEDLDTYRADRGSSRHQDREQSWRVRERRG